MTKSVSEDMIEIKREKAETFSFSEQYANYSLWALAPEVGCFFCGPYQPLRLYRAYAQQLKSPASNIQGVM